MSRPIDTTAHLPRTYAACLKELFRVLIEWGQEYDQHGESERHKALTLRIASLENRIEKLKPKNSKTKDGNG